MHNALEHHDKEEKMTVFADAVHKKRNGVDAPSKAARAKVAHAAKVLKKKLQPCGPKITVPDQSGRRDLSRDFRTANDLRR